MAQNWEELYTRTFTSYSGADITATFNGRPIAELQAITYSVSREKVPIWTMGSADPRSFSRGKRGIAGSLVFTTFDRDALFEEMRLLAKEKNGYYGFQYQTYATNIQSFARQYLGKNSDKMDDDVFLRMQEVNAALAYAQDEGNMIQWAEPEYNDQLLPFNISILFANEYGQRSRMDIYHVEILNEGMGMSVDDVSLKALTFVARKVKYMRPFETSGKLPILMCASLILCRRGTGSEFGCTQSAGRYLVSY